MFEPVDGGNGDAGFYILNVGGSNALTGCPSTCDNSLNPFSDVQEAHNTWVTGSNMTVPGGTNLEHSGGVSAT